MRQSNRVWSQPAIGIGLATVLALPFRLGAAAAAGLSAARRGPEEPAPTVAEYDARG